MGKLQTENLQKNKECITMAIERTYIMLKPDCIKRGLMGVLKKR